MFWIQNTVSIGFQNEVPSNHLDGHCSDFDFVNQSFTMGFNKLGMGEFRVVV